MKFTQLPSFAMPRLTFNNAPTVLVCSLFLIFVFIRFTDENTRSTSTLAWGKHNSDPMNVERVDGLVVS